MALNLFKSPDQTLMLLQKQWTSQLNPLLAVILTQGSLLTGIKILRDVPNTFNTYLGRQMTGWFIVDQDSYASIYRTEPLNSQTLTLTSDENVTVSLWVF
jgi:hypothetical protein